MVVDDDPALVEILRIRLESEGFNVRCGYSGKDLFAGLEELKLDLIVLDIMMPQMDGLKLLTRLKENLDMASIPVILLTANVQYEDVLTGYKKGADYYMTKPFTTTQLLPGINSLLSRSRRFSRKPVKPSFLLSRLSLIASELIQQLFHNTGPVPSCSASSKNHP